MSREWMRQAIDNSVELSKAGKNTQALELLDERVQHAVDAGDTLAVKVLCRHAWVVADATGDIRRKQQYDQVLRQLVGRPQPGDAVVLLELPPGFLADLPVEDQKAISEVVGGIPVLLNTYDDAGRAEIEFTDRTGMKHFLYVSPEYITWNP